jgi:hypothetical protein
MITSTQQLLNAGSKLMNVDGSVTPKSFTYTASAPVELVTGIICILKDEGTTSFGNFGAASALTNGVMIQVTQGGNTRTIATIKDNADLCMVFPDNQFGNGAVLSILSVVSPEGFGDTNNCFVGSFAPVNPITLASGDIVTVTVRDNLSGIDVFQMSLNVCVD